MYSFKSLNPLSIKALQGVTLVILIKIDKLHNFELKFKKLKNGSRESLDNQWMKLHIKSLFYVYHKQMPKVK